jgi:hypothetical protein
MGMTKEIFKEKIKEEYDFDKLRRWVTPLPGKLLTPSQMTKAEFLESVKGNFSRVAVEAWVDQLADSPLTAAVPAPAQTPAPTQAQTTSKGKKIPSFYKKGDVLMHSVFRHPCVLLDKKGDSWICGLLTSEPTCTEILAKADSRFFHDNYFTKTIFTLSDPSLCQFMYPFDNDKQIEEVLIKIKEIFS